MAKQGLIPQLKDLLQKAEIANGKVVLVAHSHAGLRCFSFLLPSYKADATTYDVLQEWWWNRLPVSGPGKSWALC